MQYAIHSYVILSILVVSLFYPLLLFEGDFLGTYKKAMLKGVYQRSVLPSLIMRWGKIAIALHTDLCHEISPHEGRSDVCHVCGHILMDVMKRPLFDAAAER